MIPSISGTVGGQTVADNGTIDPFASASIYDPNPYTTDSVTVTLLDNNGQPTDNNGSLQLASGASRDDTTVTKTATGTYVLNDLTGHQANTFVSGLNAYLDNMQFIPASGSDGTTTTMQIALTDQDNEHAIDLKTSVTVSGSSPNASNNQEPTNNQQATSDQIDAKRDDSQFLSSVPAGQTNTLSGDSYMLIEFPNQYAGNVQLLSGVLGLDRLSDADSFTFKNDMLSIFGDGGKLLDTLNFTADSKPFTIQKVGSQVSLYTADDQRHLTGGTIFGQS